MMRSFSSLIIFKQKKRIAADFFRIDPDDIISIDPYAFPSGKATLKRVEGRV